MKTYVDMNKLQGRKRPDNVTVIKGGYLRTYGGIIAVGYESNGGKIFELAVELKVIERAIAESKIRGS